MKDHSDLERPPTYDVKNPQIREEIYNSLISHWLLPEEQKGGFMGTRGTRE